MSVLLLLGLPLYWGLSVSMILLLGLPLLFAVFVLFAKNQQAHKYIIRTAAGLIIASTALFVFVHYNEVRIFDLSRLAIFRYAVWGAISLISLAIGYLGIKSRRFLLLGTAVLQLSLITWFIFFSGQDSAVYNHIYIDKFTLIMIIIIGLVGGLVCLCSEGYMDVYHERHPEMKDRRSVFFAVFLVSIFAMLGLVISNDLMLMLLFLQILSLCSFYLIGYTQSSNASSSSITAIIVNVFGDLCFMAGLVVLAVFENVLDLNGILSLDSSSPDVMVAVLLLASAGLVKAAQFPFAKWLLDAVETPSPVLAMLHSVTMVKAGVFLIVRLSPMFGVNPAGISVTFVGGLTFIIGAVLAGLQVDAKKVLAFSSVSTMGLVIAAAGLSTPASLWTAIMLIILHAFAKSLLFLSFGSAEHQPGDRDVEHMRGMHGMSMRLAMFLIVGMAGMLVAPYVMLLARWTAMQAFMDSGNILIIMIITFGSTVALFYWTKWIGKLIAHAHLYSREVKYPVYFGEKVSLFILAGFVVFVCILYPLVSEAIVIPFIRESMLAYYASPISPDEISVIVFMLAMLLIIPVILIPYFRKYRTKRASTYLSGVNTGDNETFKGAMGQIRRYELRNRFIFPFLNERKFYIAACAVCATIIIGGFFFAMGGAII